MAALLPALQHPSIGLNSTSRRLYILQTLPACTPEQINWSCSCCQLAAAVVQEGAHALMPLHRQQPSPVCRMTFRWPP